MAAPFGPPPSVAITWIFPAGVTRESVRRSISTRITEPSGIAIGPSGNRRPEATCLIFGRHSRSAPGSPGRDERWGVWGAMSGPSQLNSPAAGRDEVGDDV